LHCPQFARQRQFAQALDLCKAGRWHLAVGGQDAQGNGQVVAPTYGLHANHGHSCWSHEFAACFAIGMMSTT